MLITISKERWIKLLREEIKAWESVGGGPNINAFSFNPKTTDPQILKELGYYDNRESWIAGMRIKELQLLIQELENSKPITVKQ